MIKEELEEHLHPAMVKPIMEKCRLRVEHFRITGREGSVEKFALLEDVENGRAAPAQWVLTRDQAQISHCTKQLGSDQHS